MRDERVKNLLLNLSNHNQIDFNLKDISAPKDMDKIRLQDLSYHSRKSFPPCMKALYTALKNQHHLKHYGRLQLGLFLKGIGFTVEEALQFWRQEFVKVDGDKFEKQYAYNIRHSYGGEGKKADYRPKNCTKVINQPAPGQGEYHGCPFKTFGDPVLRNLLKDYDLSSTEVEQVMSKRQEKHYQVACLRLYEFSHKGSVPDNVGNHPNSFFNSSVQFLKGAKDKDQKQ
jgi:DNA primase large subunit